MFEVVELTGQRAVRSGRIIFFCWRRIGPQATDNICFQLHEALDLNNRGH